MTAIALQLCGLDINRMRSACVIAVIFWIGMGVLVTIAAGLHSLLPDPTFETKEECVGVLYDFQYRAGHHREECLELESGRWRIFDRNRNAL